MKTDLPSDRFEMAVLGCRSLVLVVNIVLLHNVLAYDELFSLGANFPKWLTLIVSRNFPDLEIHDLNN